ncbi:DUF1761 domain-containing protein [Candidatus Kaiserbacteria bacterium]|nr:DUF1761 domain-containing protein [Candidatus Kaiserbacteria bacterium]
MEINYTVVLGLAVIALIVSAIWYGPLFGKAWIRTHGADADDLKKRKEMQKKAGPLYVIQFLLVLFQIYVLAHYVKGWDTVSGIENALWLWGAFIMPTVAASSMWTNDTAAVKWVRFLIQAGCQLVLFILFGYVLGVWG